LILAVGSWRYIFLINVPVGIIGLCVVARLVPPLPAGKSGRFDWKGFVLIATAITSIMLLIETGGAHLGGVSGSGIILTSVGLIAGMLYFRYAMREKAIVDLRLLRRDTLAVSIGATWVQRMALGATPFLLPLLLQSAMGFSALAASQVMTALAAGGLAARFFVPTIVRKFGFRLAGLTMAATNAVMSALPAFFYMDTPLVWMMVAVAVSSLTRGLFFIMTQTLAYADVTKDEVGHVSVLYTVAQQLSYGLGVTVAAWLLHLEAGTARLTVADFHLPFLVMSAIAATSILAFLPLRADAGDALSGRPDDEVIVN
jgi:MFS family permease